jgi:hypothetical protein
MEYSIKKLSKDNFYLLLDTCQENELRYPLTKNPKHFAPMAKGFRLNKLPKNILYKIYYEEINKSANNLLEELLLKCIKDQINLTKIPEIIDNFNGNIYELGISLEKEIRNNGLNISPHILLIIGKLPCEELDLNLIKDYHNYYKECISEEVAKQSATYEEQIKELRTIVDDNALEIKHSKYNISEQDKKIVESNHENDALKLQLNDYDLTKQFLTGQQIDEMKATIQELEYKSLSADDFLEICHTIIHDLRKTGIQESDLRANLRKLFDSSLTIADVWKIIIEKSQKKIDLIISEMAENHVNAKNIEELDDIENGICSQYLIIKSMRALFLKYLEKGASRRTIDTLFKNKVN